MQTRDDQMIFEQYQQIDEITMPFTGGKQMSIGKRLKKFIPGRIGKRAGREIDVESDVNHFHELLQDLADKTNTTVAKIVADTPNFNKWVQRNIKVDPAHVANWNQLVKAAVAESGKMMHGYKALNSVIAAAIHQRNKDLAYGAGNSTQTNTPETPAAPQGYASSPASDHVSGDASSTTTAQQPTTPAAAATTPSTPNMMQGRKAIDDAASTLSRARSRDRSKLIDYALDKFAAIDAGSNKPTKNSTASTPTSIRTTGNVKPAKSKATVTAKESVYIDSNIITEDIQFIDCSRF